MSWRRGWVDAHDQVVSYARWVGHVRHSDGQCQALVASATLTNKKWAHGSMYQLILHFLSKIEHLQMLMFLSDMRSEQVGVHSPWHVQSVPWFVAAVVRPGPGHMASTNKGRCCGKATAFVSNTFVDRCQMTDTAMVRNWQQMLQVADTIL